MSELPPAMMPPGYDQTLADIRRAFEDRLTNATFRLTEAPTYHRGIPDAGTIDSTNLSIWLDWTDVFPDDEEPSEATMLVSRWLITIVGPDEGGDAFGTESPKVERIWGGVLTTLTQFTVDLGLDGTCDFVPTPTARKGRGNVTGSDKRVMVIEMDVEVHHSMELTRLPPGVLPP